MALPLCMGLTNYPFNETFTTLFAALIMGKHRGFFKNAQNRRAADWGRLLEAVQKAFPAV